MYLSCETQCGAEEYNLEVADQLKMRGKKKKIEPVSEYMQPVLEVYGIIMNDFKGFTINLWSRWTTLLLWKESAFFYFLEAFGIAQRQEKGRK